MRSTARKPFALLARVRRSLRVLNGAIDAACRDSDLTMQQQAFLLALAAHEQRAVPLADVRTELLMDQATASDLLARLQRAGLVRRATAEDRRALELSLTASGRSHLVRSIEHMQIEMQRADSRGELAALRESLADYLDFYTSALTRSALRANPRAPRRGAGRGPSRDASRTRRAGA